eukprot:71954-Rhodomonas_salina.1
MCIRDRSERGTGDGGRGTGPRVTLEELRDGSALALPWIEQLQVVLHFKKPVQSPDGAGTEHTNPFVPVGVPLLSVAVSDIEAGTRTRIGPVY